MAQPASYRAMYTYAWDLIDEGFAAVADRFRSVNANTVALATSYHAGKFIRPHGRSGKVYFPEDGTIYFRHRPERYGRVSPLPNALLKEIDTPERLLLRDEIEATIFRAIEALPEDLRTAITLREIEGMSYEEIAQSMGCPIGTVRSRIFRAREAIDRHLRPLVDG